MNPLETRFHQRILEKHIHVAQEPIDDFASQLKDLELARLRREKEIRQREEEIQRRVQEALEAQQRAMRREVLRAGLQQFFTKIKPTLVKDIKYFAGSSIIKGLEKRSEEMVKRIYGVDVDIDLQTDIEAEMPYWMDLSFHCLFPDMRLLNLGEAFFNAAEVHEASIEKIAVFGFIKNWYKKLKAKRQHKQAYAAFEKQIWPLCEKASNMYLGILSKQASEFQKTANRIYGRDSNELETRFDFKGPQVRSIALALLGTISGHVPDYKTFLPKEEAE
jgi:hypothetical protein